MDEVAAWIERVNAGEPGARERLFAATYGELRKLARSRLYAGGRSTLLDTTALVHEGFLRFVRSGTLRSTDRRAFFAYAAATMRSVIVDAVRERQALRRGGDLARLTLDSALAEALPGPPQDGEDEILKVHEALAALQKQEPRLARVVEMRYFVGSTEQEIADALGITERTVRRDWDKARRVLRALLLA